MKSNVTIYSPRILHPLVLLVVIILISHCKSEVKRQEKNSSVAIEDFDDFYKKFHSDSTFQISRLRFPLEGKKVNEEGIIEWTKENWLQLKGTVFDIDTTKFKTEFKRTKTTFYEKVWIEESCFSFECKFKLIENKWYLVYAEDIDL